MRRGNGQSSRKLTVWFKGLLTLGESVLLKSGLLVKLQALLMNFNILLVSDDLCDLLLEAIDVPFKFWREAATIKFGGLATGLHPFNHGDIVVVEDLPQINRQVSQGLIFRGHSRVADEVEGEPLLGAAGTNRVGYHYQEVFGMDA